MKQLFIILASSVCLLNCWWEKNPTHQYQLDIDLSNLTPQQAEVIALAADDWKNATGGFVFFYSSKEFQPIWPEQTDNIIHITGKPISELEKGGVVGICYWHGVGSNVELPNDTDFDTLRIIATHELGHGIGAQHIAKWNIMYYAYNGDAHTIQCGDVVEICKEWGVWSGCDSKTMPVCQPPNHTPTPTFDTQDNMDK